MRLKSLDDYSNGVQSDPVGAPIVITAVPMVTLPNEILEALYVSGFISAVTSALRDEAAAVRWLIR